MMFPILTVHETQIVGDEQLGSKNKFWYESDGDRWLFKEAREIVEGEFTGEDWSEKLAAEIASVLQIPAARVELAEYRGRRGSASKRFLNSANQSLVHGNEILSGMIVGYDRDKKLHQHDHTLANIVAAFENFLPGNEPLRVAVLKQLAEYLVLDALVGNTDRHHENWGVIVQIDLETSTGFDLRVAPSFDHASSLGRELLDTRRAQCLQRGAIESYVRGGRGGIYIQSSDRFGANPLHLIEYAAEAYSTFFRPALNKVKSVHPESLIALVDAVPDARISEVAREFAKEFLRCSLRILSRL